MVTTHAPDPVQDPPQELKVDPAAGVGVRVTCVPWAKSNEQVPDAAPAEMVQLIPAGVDVTVPLPIPAPVTTSLLESFVKVAVTVLA